MSTAALPRRRFQRLGRWVARHHRHPALRRLAGWCRRYLEWHGNLSYELDDNGEGFVLETLARFAPAQIVDAGANVGDWTRAAHARCPGARITAFEISPATFEQLRARTAGLAGVTCVPSGLGERAGTVRLRHYAQAPALSTASQYPHGLPFVEIEAPVMAGADWAAQAGVAHIELLKIDVEGMEDAVLRGFEPLLAQGAIDLVQFEYGRVNILSRFLLADFHAYFAERGYVVGKIHPDHVDFRDYTLADEDFMGPNYLACRRDRADLLQALGGRR
jgi:FkbM family methyltransferase